MLVIVCILFEQLGSEMGVSSRFWAPVDTQSCNTKIHIYVHMYICIYIQRYTYIYTCLYKYILYILLYIDTYMNIRICIYVCRSICIDIDIYIYIYAYFCLWYQWRPLEGPEKIKIKTTRKHMPSKEKFSQKGSLSEL